MPVTTRSVSMPFAHSRAVESRNALKGAETFPK
ncbi:hypothetical protein STAL104432_05695 [Streptomyces albus]